MIDKAQILAQFDTQTRAHPPAVPGLTREWADSALRSFGTHNFIAWWNMDIKPEAVDGAIAAQADFFHSCKQKVEWKVYSHDRPTNLEARLEANGWKADERETFLVFDMEDNKIAARPAHGVEVRRVQDRSGIEDYVAVSGAAFESCEDCWLETLTTRLSDPSLSVYVAYVDGTAPASARLELSVATAFAGLYGGGTAPAYRGRGLYRSLMAARAAEAKARGYRYLTVDALETSKPILERLGFEALATVRGWILSP